jgi:anti-sigma factor RsiW
MNCADAVARLSAALDGELAAGDAREVQQHLITCEACARRYRVLQQVRAAVRSIPFTPVDAGRFDAGVLARVSRDGTSTRISGAWIAAAAVLVIAVSSAVLMLQSHAGVAPPGRAESIPPTQLTETPGWNDGQLPIALDCGTVDAPSCVVEGPAGLMAGN